MSDSIKRLVLGMIPNQKCNLKCEYCYISQVEAWDEPTPLKYTPEHVARCLSKERLGGTCLINLTGNGETLLQPDITALVEALLKEGHYVEIVTNGTVTKRIREILALPDELLERLFFKLSFHYAELKRLNLMDSFFENVKAIKASPASFTLELMAYDGIEDQIDDIVDTCVANVGAACQATIGRNDARKDRALLSAHSEEEFRKVWAPLDSMMLNFKLDVIGVKRKEFCYAGDWSLFVNMNTGESQPCYWQPYDQNLFEDPNAPIKFRAVGRHCSQPYCTNAHSHLCWGVIPEIDAPKYAEMRDRETADGSSFLKEGCAEFFSSKLYESNEEYPPARKVANGLAYPFHAAKGVWRDRANAWRRIKSYVKRKGKRGR